MEFRKFDIMAWNIIGALNKFSKCHIKNLVAHYRPALMVVLETHVVFEKVKMFWKRLGYSPVGIVEAQGHMGGIWVFVHGPFGEG